MDGQTEFSTFQDDNNDNEFLTLISEFVPNEDNNVIEKSLNPSRLNNEQTKFSNFSTWSNDDLISLAESSELKDFTNLTANKSTINPVSHIIEAYTRKFHQLEESNNLKENREKFADTTQFSITKTATLLDNTNRDRGDLTKLTACNESVKTKEQQLTHNKIKFKNLFEFKKDVIIRKLLKTIDLMNMEMNKRDKLILNMEKEIKILSKEKKSNDQSKELSKNDPDALLKANEEIYLNFEMNRLKQEILSEKIEKESLKQKLVTLEHQISESFIKIDDLTTLSDYKEILLPFSTHIKENKKLNVQLENLNTLKKENEELAYLNDLMKAELEKLTKQIKLLERKDELENEINDKFDDLVAQNRRLESENCELKNRLDDCCEKNQLNEKKIEEISNLNKVYQQDLNDYHVFKKKQKEEAYELISNYEEQLKEINLTIEQYNDERIGLIKTVKSIQEEKSHLIEQLNAKNSQYETKLTQLEKELDEKKQKYEEIERINFEQQKQIQKLFSDLDEKNSSTEKQSAKKWDEIKRLRQSLNMSQEKIKYLQAKHESDVDEMRKKYSKEFEQMKFTNEQTTIRNGELSRSNGDFRKKIQQLEVELKELNEKCFVQKQTIEFLNKQKKELKEEMDRNCFLLKKDIDVLEQLRDEYLKKNNQQQVSIDEMLTQIKSFQSEIESLIKRNSSLDEKWKRSISAYEIYKSKYNELKQYVKNDIGKKNH